MQNVKTTNSQEKHNLGRVRKSQKTRTKNNQPLKDELVKITRFGSRTCQKKTDLGAELVNNDICLTKSDFSPGGPPTVVNPNLSKMCNV